MNAEDCDTVCAPLDPVPEGTNLVVTAVADAEGDTAFAGCKYKLVVKESIQLPAIPISTSAITEAVDGTALFPIQIPLQVNTNILHPLILRGSKGIISGYVPKQVLGKFRVGGHGSIGPLPYVFPKIFSNELIETANPDFYLGANDVNLICSEGKGPVQLLKITNLGDPPALPIAIDDAIEVEFETEFNFAAISNDTGVGIEIISASNPPHGTATVELDGTISYLPDDGFFGTDSFTYTIADDSLNEDTATVTVTVLPPAEMLAWWDASLLSGADNDPVALLPDLEGDLDFITTAPDVWRVFKPEQWASGTPGSYWWIQIHTGTSIGPIVETILLGPDIGGFAPAFDVSRNFQFGLTLHIGTISAPGPGIAASVESVLISAPLLQLAAQNGLNTLLFATNAAMAAAVNSSWGITDAGTIFLVIKQISGTAPIFNFDNPDNDNRFAFVYDAAGSVYVMWGDVGAGTGIRSVVYAVDTNWTVLTLRRSVNGFELFRDGASIWVPSDFASALGWNGASSLSLANSSQALGTFKSFELGEMMIFPSALSAGDRHDIEEYLGDKWDITIT